MSETLRAFEALPLPANYNLSVSEDSLGTTFALFLPESTSDAVETWAARIESTVTTSDLRIQTIDVEADRALWVTLLDRLGVTITASGTTREEIQAQVDRQLEALGSGRASVEHVTEPNGRGTVRITVEDIP